MASRVAATQAVSLCCRKGLRTQAWPVVHPIDPPKPPPATEPGIQRVQEEAFDKVVEMEKDYLFVSRMRKLAMQKPERYVELSDLSPEDRLLLPVLENYPAVFELVREGSRRCWTEGYRLTLRAEQLSSEEENVMKQMEDHFVTVLRKVLMLSIGRRLPLEKLGYLAPHLGLPNDFERPLVHQYPHFLHVVTLKDSTPLLKLTSWDAQLALSLEEVKKHQVLQSKASDEKMELITTMEKFLLPKGYNLSKRHRKMLARFRNAPFVSPYEDPRDFDCLEIKFEKHAVAGLKELLSFTVEKRMTLDTLAHFSQEFTFSYKPRNLVLRHPQYFYLSEAGNQETLFLREGYHHGKLVEKNPLVLMKEKFGPLLGTRRSAGPNLNVKPTIVGSCPRDLLEAQLVTPKAE